MKKLVTLLSASIFALSLQAAETTAQKNKKIAEKFIHDVYDLRNFDAIPNYVHADFVDHSPGAAPDAKGPQFVREQAEGTYKLFPDLKFATQRMIAEGDLVAIHWKATGTSAPRPEANDPGGKKVTIEGTSIMAFRDGKIVDSWDIVDRIGMLRQLGFTLVPPK